MKELTRKSKALVRHCRYPVSRTWNTTWFGKGAFAGVIKGLTMRSSCITRVGPTCNDKCLVRARRRQRRPCVDEEAWCSHKPTNPQSHQMLDEAEGSPADTLSSDFQSSELRKGKFLLF